MTAPYASAVVEARLDWGNIDAEFETRVRAATAKAAQAAEKNLRRIKLAANVSLNAETALFRRETQEKLRKVALAATVELRTTKAEIRRFTTDINARLAAQRVLVHVQPVFDEAALRARLATLPDANVKANLTVTNSEIRRFSSWLNARLAVENITVPVLLDMDEAAYRARLAALTRPVTQQINIRTSGGGGDLDRSFGRIGRHSPSIAKIGGLVAAIGAAAGVAAGAVGALGAGLAGVGVVGVAGLVTAVVGLQGIGDAFSALSAEAEKAGADTKAQASAIEAAAKQVAQAEKEVVRAEKEVVDAQKDVVDAQEDVNKAREDAKDTIDDLNFALKGTAIDERDATLALARAREAYDETFRDPAASALDRSEAALNVDKALRRQEEVGRRNTQLAEDAAEANRKGIEGSDQVVAAKERVTDAEEKVADAQERVAEAHESAADAQKALQDAMTQTSAAASKAQQALDKLSPNARAFVLAMRELKPELSALKDVVQDNMFAGLDSAFTGLIQTSLPMLKEGMGGVATSINGAAKSFATFWSSAQAQQGLKEIFAGTATFIATLQPGLQQLSQGILSIGQAAAPVMAQIGASLGGLLGSIGQAFTDAFADGSLTKLFSTFATVLDGLGAGLQPLIAGLIEFGNIVGPFLGPLLQSLGEALGSLAPSLGQLGAVFAASLTQLMPYLGQFISALADGLAPVLPIIAQIFAALGTALTPLIPPLSEVLQVVGVVLRDALVALAPAIAPLGEAFAALVAAVAPFLPVIAEVISTLVQALAPALTTIFEALGPVISQWLDGMAPVLRELAPILADVAMQLGQAIADALIQLMPLLPTLIDSFSRIVMAVAPFLPQLATMWAEYLPKLIDVMVWLIENVLPPMTSAFEWLARNVFPLVIDAVRLFADVVADKVGFAKMVVEQAQNGIGTAVDGIKGFFTGLKEVVVDVWDGIVETVKSSVGRIGQIIKGAGKAIEWAPGDHGENLVKTGQSLIAWSESKATGGVVAGQRANGVLFGPGTGTSDDILGLSASGLPTARVAAGEMLVNKKQTDRNLPLLTAINSGWTPSPELVRALVYGSGLQGYAGGGVVESFQALASKHAPGLQLTSSYRDTNDYHGQGMAVDYSNGSGNTDEQLAWANFLADHYQSQLKELIYSDPRFTRNIKDGKIVDGKSFYGADTMAQHENHVHAASATPLPDTGDLPAPDAESQTQAAPDTRTSKQRHVDEVIAEGRRRGMSDKQIKAAVMAMLAESDGKMYANESDPESLQYAHDAVGSDHDSSGLFQQRNNGAWGTAADRMDPAKSAGMFYEELAKHDESSMSEAQLAQAVQRSAFADGSNYAAKDSEAESLIAESNARGNGTTAAPIASTFDAGSAQAVFVTNWPSNLGGSSSLTAAATAASHSSGVSSPSPAVVGAAVATGSLPTAFDPGNTGYDDTYYNDTVARGGVEGANAWLARQDFGPSGRTWFMDTLKEIGGEFAEPLGLSSGWGNVVDRQGAELIRATNAGESGTTIINNTFNGYQGTPQQMIAELERSQRQRMTPVTGTYRHG